jgi:hypothetical protein
MRGRRFKAELRHWGFDGRPLRVLHGVRKRERRRDGHGTPARGRGDARPSGLARPAWPDRSIGPDGSWARTNKKENINLFQN